MTAGRPLLYLDVDGVINDLEAVMAFGILDDVDDLAERLSIDIVHSHGYRLAIPTYMPELIGALDTRCEIVWCTTWRNRANDEIAAHLGVGPYPALDPDGDDMTPDWKADHVRRHAAADLAAGRTIIWIEDFYGRLPDIEGIRYVDTGDHAVLRWQDLPIDVLPD